MELFKLLGTIAVNNSEANQSIDDTTGKAEKSGSKLSSLLGGVGKVASGIGSVATSAMKATAGAAVAVCGALVTATETTREYRTEMGKLDTAFVTSGHSSESAKNTYSELNSILGDSGQAVEAANHLALLTNNEKDLQTWTDICTGVYATFGASLPIEGLTEAANETAKVGQVTGAVADALNWAGISEDEFNKKLEKCSSEQERQKLIMETLNQTYSDASTQYKETNKDVIESQKVNQRFSDMMAKLGAMAEPILNTVKGAFAGVLESMMPLVEKAMPQIQSAIEQFLPIIIEMVQSVLPILMDLLSGLIPSLMDLIQTVLPILMDVIKQLLPFVVELVQKLLPVFMDILNAILPPLMQIIEQLLPIFMELIDKLLPVFVQLVEALLPIFVQLIEAIIPILEPLLALLQPILDLFIALLEPLLSLINLILPPLIDGITLLIQGALAVLQPIIEWLADFLGNELGAAITGISDLIIWCKDAFVEAWEGIQTAWSVVCDFFSGIWEGIKSAFGNVAEWFRSIFSTAWQKVKDVFSAGGKVFDGIKEGIAGVFKTVVNGLIGGINKVIKVPFNAINKMLNKIRSISIVGVKPFSWIKEDLLTVPQIPKLEKGGVLEKGQVGLLEGNGAEAVVPLEKNEKWISNVSKDMKEQGIGGSAETLSVLQEILAVLKDLKASNANLPDALTDSIASGLRLNIDNREFARLVKVVM